MSEKPKEYKIKPELLREFLAAQELQKRAKELMREASRAESEAEQAITQSLPPGVIRDSRGLMFNMANGTVTPIPEGLSSSGLAGAILAHIFKDKERYE